MNMLRLFLAIPLSLSTKAQLSQIAESHRPLFEKASWVKEENYHITLFFLGMVTEEELDRVKEIASAVAKDHGPFSLEFEKLELKPKRNPKIFWCRFHENDAFSRLSSELGKALSRAIKLEKQPNEQIPHITLARPRRGEVKPLPDFKQEFPAVDVENFTLYRSELLTSGPVYHPLESFPLVKKIN